MRIVIISDTHGLHEDLPEMEGDVLIHCGDFERTAEIDWWFNELPFRHKIVVPGNHDHDAEEKWLEEQTVFHNGSFLIDETIVIDGLNIYGTPWVNELEGAAFALDYDQIEKKWSEIPDDTDILITHVPPFGILDMASNGENWGCKLLGHRVEEMNLRFHCFGHVHASYGMDDHYGISFINASNISGGEIVNQPVVIEL